MASFGSSSEKYANINVRVRSIQNLFESSGVEGSDILVVTLFEAQAKQWKRQLVLRLSNAAIEVATAGKAQGNKKKLAVADFTVANMVAPGCLGFLRRWNRPNIMLSRSDFINCGDVFTVTGGSSLSHNRKPASQHSSTWSSKQGESETKKSKSKLQMENDIFKNGKIIEAEELAWQLGRLTRARSAESTLAAQEALNTEMVGGELVEEAAADAERSALTKKQASA
ncbi:hypothetical protein ACMFMF_004833 [Clarireedia jacksonii]